MFPDDRNRETNCELDPTVEDHIYCVNPSCSAPNTPVRENDEFGEDCSSCGEELLWDTHEKMVYCRNDWSHG